MSCVWRCCQWATDGHVCRGCEQAAGVPTCVQACERAVEQHNTMLPCMHCLATIHQGSLPPHETGPHLNRPCAGVVLGALLPGCGRHAHYIALLVAACGANGGLSHLPARQHGVLEAMHTRGCQILCSTQQYAEDGMCCTKPLVVAVLSCKPIMVASAQRTRPSLWSSLGQDAALCCSSAICKCMCAVACSSFAWSCLYIHITSTLRVCCGLRSCTSLVGHTTDAWKICAHSPARWNLQHGHNPQQVKQCW